MYYFYAVIPAEVQRNTGISYDGFYYEIPVFACSEDAKPE